MAAYGADVCCVGGPAGISCTDFYVKFNIPPIDLAFLVVMGLHVNSSPLQSATAFGGLSETTTTMQSTSNSSSSGSSNSMVVKSVESEGVPVRAGIPSHIKLIKDNRDGSQDTNKLNNNSKNEPQWIEIYCNDVHCDSVKALVGPEQFMYFLDEVSHNLSRIPTQDMLKSFKLRKGKNAFTCKHSLSNATAHFSLWLYDYSEYLIIMDIDGTITKSDVRGYFESVFLGVFSYIHDGIVPLLCSVVDNCRCKVLYLTSRPITHMAETRKMLAGIRESGLHIPEGALWMNREATLQAVYNEVIAKKAAEYKSNALLKIVSIFSAAGRPVRGPHPLAFGIGNKLTDAEAYTIAGISKQNILIISKSSKLRVYASMLEESELQDKNKKKATLTKQKSSESLGIQPRSVKSFIGESDIFLTDHYDNMDDESSDAPGSNRLLAGQIELFSKEAKNGTGNKKENNNKLFPFQSYKDPMLLGYIESCLIRLRNSVIDDGYEGI